MSVNSDSNDSAPSRRLRAPDFAWLAGLVAADKGSWTWPLQEPSMRAQARETAGRGNNGNEGNIGQKGKSGTRKTAGMGEQGERGKQREEGNNWNEGNSGKRRTIETRETGETFHPQMEEEKQQ